MTVLLDDIAAVFFIDREKPIARAPLSTLLTIAGGRDFRPDPETKNLMSGTWADIPCDGSVAERKYYRQLWISFQHSCFMERVYPRPEHERLEDETGLSLVQAFQNTCDSLEVDVGMLLTHNWQASDEWMIEQESAVLDPTSIHLHFQGVGLLYLDQERVRVQPSHPIFDGREQLPTQRGRLYFSGFGRERWL